MSFSDDELRSLGFGIEHFDHQEAFEQALPTPMNLARFVDGRIGRRTIQGGDLFFIELVTQPYVNSHVRVVRWWIHLRHPAFAGKAYVTSRGWRTFVVEPRLSRRLLQFLFMVVLVVPILLVTLLTLFSRDKNRLRFGGVFDRHFKVHSATPEKAMDLLTPERRKTLVESDLIESLQFSDGITVGITNTNRVEPVCRTLENLASCRG